MRKSVLRFAVLLGLTIPVAPAHGQSNDGADSSRHRNYLIPAVELTGFLALLNGYDRIAYANEVEADGKKTYSSTFSTTWDHLREQRWVHDQDPFNINQIGHPYQGAMMFSWPRSTGLGFWTSLVYSDVGSFAWEMAGETSSPSINDLITTGQAGSLLGETLYRISDLVLKDNGGEFARRLHDYLAMVLSPQTAVNRHMFGHHYKVGLPDSTPATAWQIGLGAALDAHANDPSLTTTQLRQSATAQFSMEYGLPGTPGYSYDRPLDYFDFQASGFSSTSNPIESVMLRGLLLGRKIGRQRQLARNLGTLWKLRLHLALLVPSIEHRAVSWNDATVLAFARSCIARVRAWRRRVWGCGHRRRCAHDADRRGSSRLPFWRDAAVACCTSIHRRRSRDL
jgi:hypothetical protein